MYTEELCAFIYGQIEVFVVIVKKAATFDVTVLFIETIF